MNHNQKEVTMTTRKTIDAQEIYAKLEAKGIATEKKLCCGRTTKRRDFHNMLASLDIKGSYKVVDKGIIVAIVDLK